MALAATMKLEVVAEGVETLEQLTIIKQSECSLVQGYYFSRPLAEAACSFLLKNGLPAAN